MKPKVTFDRCYFSDGNIYKIYELQLVLTSRDRTRIIAYRNYSQSIPLEARVT